MISAPSAIETPNKTNLSFQNKKTFQINKYNNKYNLSISFNEKL